MILRIFLVAAFYSILNSTAFAGATEEIDKAFAANKVKNKDQEILHFTKALKEKDADVGARQTVYWFRGKAYLAQNKLDAALSDFNKGLELKLPSLADQLKYRSQLL
jgi:hypothetical protein